MKTITTQITDDVYESIVQEAARRAVSIDEVIDNWLVEGEEANRAPESPEELDAFYAREDHHMTERRALREWH